MKDVIFCLILLFTVGCNQPTYVDHHDNIQVEGELLTGAVQRSPKWPTVRNKYIKQHNSCEACGSRYNLNVHHVKSFRLHPEKELDPTNLITLCRTCHLHIGHACDDKGHVNWSCENPNVREDSVKHKKGYN